MTWRDHRMRTTGALVLFGSLVLLPIRSTLAAPACATSCSARMAACRAERCPTAKGNDRRHCRDVCRAVTGCAAGAARIRTMATIVNRCRAANGLSSAHQLSRHDDRRGRRRLRRATGTDRVPGAAQMTSPRASWLPVVLGRAGSGDLSSPRYDAEPTPPVDAIGLEVVVIDGKDRD